MSFSLFGHRRGRHVTRARAIELRIDEKEPCLRRPSSCDEHVAAREQRCGVADSRCEKAVRRTELTGPCIEDLCTGRNACGCSSDEEHRGRVETCCRVARASHEQRSRDRELLRCRIVDLCLARGARASGEEHTSIVEHRRRVSCARRCHHGPRRRRTRVRIIELRRRGRLPGWERAARQQHLTRAKDRGCVIDTWSRLRATREGPSSPIEELCRSLGIARISAGDPDPAVEEERGRVMAASDCEGARSRPNQIERRAP